MKRLIFFINSLEQREKIFLFTGIYVFIIVGGIFILGSYNIDKLNKLEKKVRLETERYVELQKIINEYRNFKNEVKTEKLSLTAVEELAEVSGIKTNILTLKPYQHDFNSVEISFEKITDDQLIQFLKKIKRKGFYVISLSINDPKGNGKLNVRAVIGEKM